MDTHGDHAAVLGASIGVLADFYDRNFAAAATMITRRAM
jgi:hypothetical protein